MRLNIFGKARGTRLLPVVVAGLIAASASSHAATPTYTPGTLEAGLCDEACLNGLIDQYLAAVVANDASRLPLRNNVRYTENGQTLRLDDGLWSTADGAGDYKLLVADPKGGSVGFIGTLRESGRKVLITVRLKVDGRKISEIETLVARSTSMGGPAPNSGLPAADQLHDKPIFREVLTPAQRRPREELIAVANSYFEGLEQATGRVTPFEPTCTRVENGMQTSGNPNASRPMAKLNCGQQFDTGFAPFITEIRGRRFLAVDEARGLVYTMLSFDHAGKIKSVKMTDGSTMTVPPPFDTPYSFLMAEVFKVRGGKIAQVEAVLITTPYAMPSGW